MHMREHPRRGPLCFLGELDAGEIEVLVTRKSDAGSVASS
jgi:hypothetical protein